ncbi:hypothetical protein BDB00DRAFT_787074 [Zychaea mexicana]|uniref:uncharacterized protein n=1 Tax=Zychaea mexicana TaxID=64656 RepID=UPI0022FE1E99|nr:uncharacterized protein BDB00DRAFT_787074 [Zychaea mexicana]KAI9494453.1 hypothetical protein BDB00DRAFT_787074 [Zychaea mexicana]
MYGHAAAAATAAGLSIAICCYLAIVRRYRYKYINALRRKYPDPNIAVQDSKIAAEIFNTTLRKEFPVINMYTGFTSNKFSIGVASENPDVTAEEIDAQESRRDHAIARLNEIHSCYRIQHGDFFFQLVLFVNEPIYWINKYGYRRFNQLEMNI